MPPGECYTHKTVYNLLLTHYTYKETTKDHQTFKDSHWHQKDNNKNDFRENRDNKGN